jgi:type II secretory pathway pseudopilin PulG
MSKKIKNKASALVIAMIILGIMLIAALSTSIVSIRERKASMGENISGQAFQNAQSGVELVMRDILTGGHTTVNQLINCEKNSASSNYGFIVDASVPYVLELDDIHGVEINCDSAVLISNIASLKSVGASGDSQRAIQAIR